MKNKSNFTSKHYPISSNGIKFHSLSSYIFVSSISVGQYIFRNSNDEMFLFIVCTERRHFYESSFPPCIVFALTGKLLVLVLASWAFDELVWRINLRIPALLTNKMGLLFTRKDLMVITLLGTWTGEKTEMKIKEYHAKMAWEAMRFYGNAFA